MQLVYKVDFGEKSAMRLSSKKICHNLLHKLANAPHLVAQNNASWQQYNCCCWHVPLTLRLFFNLMSGLLCKENLFTSHFQNVLA